jgi:hypothetical protein
LDGQQTDPETPGRRSLRAAGPDGLDDPTTGLLSLSLAGRFSPSKLTSPPFLPRLSDLEVLTHGDLEVFAFVL